jgi:hypothetical protein
MRRLVFVLVVAGLVAPAVRAPDNLRDELIEAAKRGDIVREPARLDRLRDGPAGLGRGVVPEAVRGDLHLRGAAGGKRPGAGKAADDDWDGELAAAVRPGG